jgi:hypothetical protein
LAHHTAGHWALDLALYLGPVAAAAVVLALWARRDRGGRSDDD